MVEDTLRLGNVLLKCKVETKMLNMVNNLLNNFFIKLTNDYGKGFDETN